jgi:hypothetical protein
MSARPDLDRRVERWLEETAPDRASERLLAVTRGRIDSTRQRRLPAALRVVPRSTLRIALVAALALVIGVAALLAGPGSTTRVSVPTPPPSYTPATAPNPLRIVSATDWATTTIAVPLGMEAGPDGLLYVLDTKPSVTVLDPATGRPVRTWGAQGSDPGRFDLSRPDDNAGMGALAIGRDGRVYIADGANRRIQVFEPDGRFLEVLGGPVDFERVHGIAVDGDGAVYVVDHDQLRLVRLDPDGRRAWTAGGLVGAAPFDVFSVILLPDGRLLATRNGADRPALLDPSTGELVGEWGPERVWTPAEGRSLTNGIVLIYEYEPLERVELFDTAGTLLGGFYHANGPHTDRLKTPVWGDVFWPAPAFPGDGFAYTFGAAGLLRLEVDPAVMRPGS